MTVRCILLTATSLSLVLFHSRAAVLYVDVNATNATPPYADWSTAAANVQDAIDAANAGDQILVADGLYDSGSRVVTGSSASRVAVVKPITVQSVNGPAHAVIAGFQLPGLTNGDGAIRCVYLTNNATLIGFTLTNGATRGTGATPSTDRNGGGVFCRASSAIVSNCVISGNAACSLGGGVYQGAAYGCTISSNTATNGAGVYSVAASNCTISANLALGAGGGAYASALFNCSLLSNSAVTNGGGAHLGGLTNCTLSGNSAGSGGGASSAVLYRSILLNNTAVTNGGGSWSSMLKNCALYGNSAAFGGGAYSSSMTNCTLTGNSASAYGGGAYGGTINNTILYYNSAPISPDFYGFVLNFCCTAAPLPPNGLGNISAEPLLASAYRLTSGSPCRGAGSSNYVGGTDLDGEFWANPPSIGCDEFYAGTAVGPLTVSIEAPFTNAVVGRALSFSATVAGAPSSSVWNFSDGTTVTNRILTSHAWATPGDYPVVLRAFNNSNPGGVIATVTVHIVQQQLHYVALTSPNPSPPYISWATAAHTIQDAVDAATVFGATVLVSNGIYATGSRVVYGALANRVAVTNPVTVQGLGEPGAAVIQGARATGATNGDSAVRCVYLCAGASLVGVMLTNGATRAAGDLLLEQSGGGVWSAAGAGVLSNCVLTGNFSANNGAGAYSGTLRRCTLTGNTAIAGGGAHSSTLFGCTLVANSSYDGGGANNSTLNDCTVTGNWVTNAPYSTPGGGGGVSYSTLSNCNLTGNAALNAGGAADYSTLIDCVLATNSAWNPGNYPSGGATYQSSLTNCTLLGNRCSLNGGASSDGVLNNCTLLGNSALNYGGAAVSATLVGCTIQSNSASIGGGGVYNCTLTNCTIIGNTATTGGGAGAATLNRCLLSGNAATNSGGGADSSTLNSCTVVANSAYNGGGASGSTVNNSAVTGNSATNYGGGDFNGKLVNCTLIANAAGANGGGDYGGTLTNCILFYNFAAIGPNYADPLVGFVQTGSTLGYCCTTPLPAVGTGNITAEPQLVDMFHLSALSPCRGAGNSLMVSGTDLDGNVWASPPSIGCDEFASGVFIGPLAVSLQSPWTNVATGFPLGFAATVSGSAGANRWDLGDGTIVSNRAFVSHAWSAPGTYSVSVRAYNQSNPAGVSAVLSVHVVPQPIHYVAKTGASTAPYTSWPAAATNIQDAVNAATAAGALVLVSNGLYNAGGRVVYGAVSNRLAVPIPLLVRSVNGPAVTVIQGPGDGFMRCAYLTDGSSLVGFTLTNGTAIYGSDADRVGSGGGVWCGSPSVLVSNCVLAGNSATSLGGGAYSGTFVQCTLTNNTAYCGGGAYESTLNHCQLAGNSAASASVVTSFGGGAFGGTLSYCILTGNGAGDSGGGACYASLNNCLVASNSSYYAGGTSSSILKHCTLVGNSGLYDGGSSYDARENCLIYWNRASFDSSSDNYPSSGDTGTFSYCCTTPLPSGTGNFTNAPRLSSLPDDFHLQPDSPCINAGKNSLVVSSTDLDGNPRIIAGTVDVGAYEFQSPSSILSYAWAQQYGFATDGSADYADPDADRMNNWQEWVAGTDPINSASLLKLAPPSVTPPGLQLRWNSDTNRTYFVQRASSLKHPTVFTTLATNVVGQSGSTTYRDTSAPANVTTFYRVGTFSTNPPANFRLDAPKSAATLATLGWTSVTNRSYFVERSTNLGRAGSFSILQSNIAGLLGTTSFTDSNAPSAGSVVYRVGVQP